MPAAPYNVPPWWKVLRECTIEGPLATLIRLSHDSSEVPYKGNQYTVKLLTDSDPIEGVVRELCWTGTNRCRFLLEGGDRIVTCEKYNTKEGKGPGIIWEPDHALRITMREFPQFRPMEGESFRITLDQEVPRAALSQLLAHMGYEVATLQPYHWTVEEPTLAVLFGKGLALYQRMHDSNHAIPLHEDELMIKKGTPILVRKR